MSERAQVFDGCCGEPVGFFDPDPNVEIIDKWYSPHSGVYLPITRWLTKEDAEKLYGPVTDEVRGPRGGFKSITFGTKRFVSKLQGMS